MALPEIDINETVLGKLLASDVEIIKSLNLPGIKTENIVIRKAPWLIGDTFPIVVVCQDGEAINPDAGTNETDLVDYGVVVAIVFANDRDLTTNGMGLAFTWRELIRRRFQNSSLSITLPSNAILERTKVPGGTSLLIEEAKRRGLDAQYLSIRHEVMEVRTTE